MNHESSSFILSPLTIEKEGAVCSLIRRNLHSLGEQDSVRVSSFRRLKNLHETYLQEGCQFWVASDTMALDKPLGCAGVGPFHGLPLSEGMGEIRDLVVDASVRGRGIGKLLLEEALQGAKRLGYRRLYLETSQSMTAAQKLFERRGFRPVIDQTQLSSSSSGVETLPSYYLLEIL